MSVRYVALLCFLSAGSAAAQEQASERPISYYNRTSTGILAGGQHGLVTGSATTVHGIGIRHWALGAGAGVEGYERWRTVPIFGSLSYFFNDAHGNGVFLQLSAGHSICWLLSPNESIHVDGTRGGFMFSPVAGYQIAAKKLLVNISAGYKMQKMRGTYRGDWIPLLYTLDEQAERFVFLIGVGF
jgi:hypothetical protein